VHAVHTAYAGTTAIRFEWQIKAEPRRWNFGPRRHDSINFGCLERKCAGHRVFHIVILRYYICIIVYTWKSIHIVKGFPVEVYHLDIPANIALSLSAIHFSSRIVPQFINKKILYRSSRPNMEHIRDISSIWFKKGRCPLQIVLEKIKRRDREYFAAWKCNLWRQIFRRGTYSTRASSSKSSSNKGFIIYSMYIKSCIFFCLLYL